MQAAVRGETVAPATARAQDEAIEGEYTLSEPPATAQPAGADF